MKWAQVNQAMRDCFAACVKITPAEYQDYFLFELKETDTFHPRDTDSWLCELTTDIDNADQDELEEAAWQCLCEMEERVQDWFEDVWNHAPGYLKPEEVKIDADVALGLFMNRLVDTETV